MNDTPTAPLRRISMQRRAPRHARKPSTRAAVAAALLAGAACAAAVAGTLVVANAVAATATAPQAAQGFASAEAAASALAAALAKDDVAALKTILGSDAADVLDSGDAVADRAERAGFLASFRDEHVLTKTNDSSYTLEVGADGWPLPIPIVKRADGRWAFDTPAGRQEIVYRRIGANELSAISVCEGFVEAQREYASVGRDGGPPGVFAQRLLSSAGRRDGLFWETKDGEPPSPAGPFLAAASAEGYADGVRSPYHGYYYRQLKAQGPNAPGGAKSFLSGGRLTNGFALVAYPAQYRAGGVMTFIVGQDGRVFQKDLGPDTEKLALAMPTFDPDPSWRPVE